MSNHFNQLWSVFKVLPVVLVCLSKLIFYSCPQDIQYWCLPSLLGSSYSSESCFPFLSKLLKSCLPFTRFRTEAAGPWCLCNTLDQGEVYPPEALKQSSLFLGLFLALWLSIWYFTYSCACCCLFSWSISFLGKSFAFQFPIPDITPWGKMCSEGQLHTCWFQQQNREGIHLPSCYASQTALFALATGLIGFDKWRELMEICFSPSPLIFWVLEVVNKLKSIELASQQ